MTWLLVLSWSAAARAAVSGAGADQEDAQAGVGIVAEQPSPGDVDLLGDDLGRLLREGLGLRFAARGHGDIPHEQDAAVVQSRPAPASRDPRTE